MYIKVVDGVVVRNPYSFQELRKDNPNTSFPEKPSDSLLQEWGVFRLKYTDPPVVGDTERVELVDPVFINGGWQQNWQIVAKNPEEISETFNTDSGAARAERNLLLTDSDWTQLNDAPLDSTTRAEWAQYRQNLRDIPQQPGFPYNIQWPSKPL